MITYGFLVAHGYTIAKGYIVADNGDEAIKKIYNLEFSDLVDEFDSDKFVEGYELIDLWEVNT